MARFDTSGVDDIIEEMKQYGQLVGETADEMLMAGAEAVKDGWRASAQKHQLVDSGDMIDSIGYPRQPTTVGDIRQIDIYPQGKDSRGVRNAEKAFILHYGSSRVDATHWVDDADEMSAEPVQNAFTKIWDDFLQGGM